MCCLCDPSEYHFTDCHSKVLERLKENVELNLLSSKYRGSVDSIQGVGLILAQFPQTAYSCVVVVQFLVAGNGRSIHKFNCDHTFIPMS